MADSLPRFDAPPVVETVIGVQFDRLEISAAHVGWYWRSHLGDGWPTVKEAPYLPDRIEKFERIWVSPGIRFMEGTQPDRVQLVRRDEERMIQVQNTRFIYNWKKRESGEEGTAYPTYRTLLPEFEQHLDNFQIFIAENRLGELVPNQWEVVYVNYIPRGHLWETVADWPSIFPFLGTPLADATADTFNGTWAHLIERSRGRLFVEIRHSKDSQEAEVIRLQLTARGPVSSELSLHAGCELGHETIVRAFTEMTSAKAHEHWKRTQ